MSAKKQIRADIELYGNIHYSQYIAGETFPSHTALVLIDDELFKLDAANMQHIKAFIGFSVVSGVQGEMTKVQSEGTIELQNWGLTVDTVYQVGTVPGQIVPAIVLDQLVFKKVVVLSFAGNITIKNNTAGGANTATMKLSGGVDFSATADDELGLRWNGTNWKEIFRSID